MPRARYYVDHVVLWWYGGVVSVEKCCRALELRIRRRKSWQRCGSDITNRFCTKTLSISSQLGFANALLAISFNVASIG